MQVSKRRPQSQQRLLFVDENQAELWSRLSPEQQQLCRNLISQLLQQVVCQHRQQGNPTDPVERSVCHE